MANLAWWTWDSERYMYVCSKCGANPTIGTGHVLSQKIINHEYHYCRNCGMKMIGVKNAPESDK